MERIEAMKDGKKVKVRELQINDLDMLMKFYSTLPPEDRKYLRVDVTNRELVEQRVKLIEAGNVFRLIALFEDEIIADGALELSSERMAQTSRGTSCHCSQALSA